MNLKLNINESNQLSSHINRLCSSSVGQEKSVQIYARYEDLISLVPNLIDDTDDNDDEDYRSRDYRNKNENVKDDKFENSKSNKYSNDDFRYTIDDVNDKKQQKDDQIERKMNNRCFMQKYRPTIVRDHDVNDQFEDSKYSNYEKLKNRLRKQMMNKSSRTNLDDEKMRDALHSNDRKSTKLIIEPNEFKSSLTPKSLNDFSNYWYDKTKKDRTKNRMKKPTKFLELIRQSGKQDEKNKSSCYCKIEICIPWYPCKVKYCRTDQQIQTTNYSTLKSTVDNRSDLSRCGIKSCKKCWLFYFQVDSKQQCLWDE